MKKDIKKIAIIYSGGKHFGGIETYLLSLFELYPGDEVDLTLLSLGNWELTKQLRGEGYEVKAFSGSRIRPQTIGEIRQYLVDGGYDLVISQGTVANAYARAVSYFSKIPNLVTVHSDPYFDYPNPLVRGIYIAIERITARQTKRYIAVSQYLKKLIVQDGVSESKIKVIYNGVSLPSPSSLRGTKLSSTLGHSSEDWNPDISDGPVEGDPRIRKDDNKIVIGSVGRLHAVKGYHNLITALSLLANDKIELRIAGSGGEKEPLSDLAKKLGVSKQVNFLGYIEPEKIPDFLSGLDIYIQPSLAEGFGLSVVEAMIAGKPVIVTPVGSLPEIVEDGKTGVVTDGTSPESLAVAIRPLFADVGVRHDIAKAGQKYASTHFSTSEWIDETVSVYLEAAK